MALGTSIYKAFMAAYVWLYRTSGGKLGSQGGKVVLLTTTGRKSGLRRTAPLMGIPDGDRILVAASAGGATRNPAWYHNLVANPHVTVERGRETLEMTARVAEPDERPALWQRFKDFHKGFARYESRTEREIPVVVMQPRA
jgi:deazaflavin-dependent oxidoreductase (nitroreductase family)